MTEAQSRPEQEWSSDRRARVVLGAIDAIDSGVLILDRASIIRFANLRACVLLARLPQQLEGTPVREVLGDLDAGVFDQRATMPGRRQREVTLPTGKTILVGYSTSVVEGDAEAAVAVLFQDITPKRRMQGERDLLLQLSAVGEAMPTVLHELRNPLSAVLSAIEVLMDERREDEALRSELEIIENEVRRALLGLEGLGLGTRQLRSASAESVAAAIRAVCQVLGPRAKRNRIELDVNIDELPPLFLDPGALRAVVYNLVTNAMHACKPGATVRIVARMDLATGDFELSVEDTGTGMTPEVLARCTELFFTTKRSGSGIGLALCRDLVSRGGGEIEILSALGVGTKVRITVPVAEMRPLQSGI